MAGGSTSEEMDAFDDVTPDKPVSIYDLDEDLPTRAQSSDEIAEFQKLAREKREAAFKAFKPPTPKEQRSSSPDARPSNPSNPSNSSGRPIPRESGPVLIIAPSAPPAGAIASTKPRAPEPAEPEPDLEAMLHDVAVGLERLPPAPRVPVFEAERGTLETIHGPSPVPPAPAPRPSRGRTAVLGLALVLATAATAWAYFHPAL